MTYEPENAISVRLRRWWFISIVAVILINIVVFISL